MKSLDDAMPLFQQLLTLIEKQFGSKCEVVLHDLTKDYDHSIVDIRNGYITNRAIGGCGSNLGLEVLRGTVVDGDRFNYITTTQDGKILRSSSIYVKDDDGNVIGSVCVNMDITETLQFEGYLRQFNQFENFSNEEEIFAPDVNNLLTHLIQKGQEQIGKQACDMNKNEKIEFIHFLDEKGAFLITKSGEQICELLGISKFTFYNYLETSRNQVLSDDPA
ncbi:helix-turn-helix transcriptional regulator [Anaerocolumna sp. AGMB13025]|uniref:helix-turn-helix transcriptional regulator n=1 Tax=Anaerocolumna sp. AGMB13025 TaxID=3039116 RepID=UPI00241CD157|nr:helix-turn-helix transcriptional regulator [Anaerocolumna sp. AGMB13025]WFR59500.1 helix-turn-helix transcriptional regulator [Anaerocolumna sp. AGMB13025]